MAMPRFNVSVHRERCQAHGACLKIAAAAFQLDEERKVRIADPGAVPDDTLLRAARSCPYRVITVIDAETGEQIHPRTSK
jgi:ferredoxin